MLVTIGEPQRKKRTGIVSGVMYNPTECVDQDGLYRIVMPISDLYAPLLQDAMNVWDVYIEDNDTRLYIPDAWITQEQHSIAIEFDTYTYGTNVKNPFMKRKKHATKHSIQ